MPITLDKVKKLVESAPKTGRKSRFHSLDRIVSNLRSDMRSNISNHMLPWMLLLDEAVKFFINLEKYYYSRTLTEQTSPFAAQISLTRGCIFSIRELITIGQQSTTMALSRVFIENTELLMALAEDPEFAQAYCKPENSEKFWNKHIGFGKLTPRVERFISTATGETKSTNLDHHKRLKSYLSGHIHGSHNAAFRVAFPPSLEHPGLFHELPLGSLDTNFPALCRFIAEETHLFATCMLNIFTKPNPPPALENFIVSDLLGNTITSAHVIQGLLLEFGERLIVLEDEFKTLENNEYELSFDEQQVT